MLLAGVSCHLLCLQKIWISANQISCKTWSKLKNRMLQLHMVFNYKVWIVRDYKKKGVQSYFPKFYVLSYFIWQKTLNSVFLLQSLIKKDFGLKKEDIRAMQLHDFPLAAEIAKLEQTNDRSSQNPKFKLINRILYLMSPMKQVVLCAGLQNMGSAWSTAPRKFHGKNNSARKSQWKNRTARKFDKWIQEMECKKQSPRFQFWM